jgi:hypothetical protein
MARTGVVAGRRNFQFGSVVAGKFTRPMSEMSQAPIQQLLGLV